MKNEFIKKFLKEYKRQLINPKYIILMCIIIIFIYLYTHNYDFHLCIGKGCK